VTGLRFTKSFTQQEGLSEATIERAAVLMRSGRLHRYDTPDGELSEASLLEQEFAACQGRDYCLACASGGYALHIALRSIGLKPGETVLTNAYTLAPVPGAIRNAGGEPVLVEIDPFYHIDFEDLQAKAQQSGARVLLLSLMRGHMPDMDRLVDLCKKLGLILIEDCAHTMGAHWNGRRSGSFGQVAAFSLQTYKHINAGEGGLLVSDDEQVAARAIIHSGSYMFYEQHGAAPGPAIFDEIKFETPNFSGRMDNLRALIAREQLPDLDANVQRWNRRYRRLAEGLSAIPGLTIPARDPREAYVGSSIQFRADGLTRDEIPAFVSACQQRGVILKWFGEPQPRGFASRYDSWKYLDEQPRLPNTLEALEKTVDMRVPLTFDLEDCGRIVGVIRRVVEGKRLEG
jgi:dTDP-4-amino-4,6-dideoxygalactose transaminase